MKKFAMLFCVVLFAGLGLLRPNLVVRGQDSGIRTQESGMESQEIAVGNVSDRFTAAQSAQPPEKTKPNQSSQVTSGQIMSPYVTPILKVPIPFGPTDVVTVPIEGRVLEGYVLDADGKPIANAHLNCGGEAVTDANGHFWLNGPDFSRGFANILNMLVVAESYSSVFYPVNLGDNERPLEIRMTKGGEKVRMRVVDSSGNPIPNIFVNPNEFPKPGERRTWHFSIATGSFFEKATITDENGLWEFEMSPDVKLFCSLSPSRNDKYMRIFSTESDPRVILQPGDEILEIVLPDCFTIKGKILDVATGDTIPDHRIRLVATSSPSRDVSGWNESMIPRNEDGSYYETIRIDYPEYSMTVTAEGYFPQTVTFTKEGGDRTLDIHLKPDPGLSGTLLDTSGNPASNGAVAMSKASTMTVRNGNYGGSISRTGERMEEFKNINRDGSFTFDKSYEQYHLLSANSQQGFAIMTREEFEQNGNVIQLRPWGRLEVTTVPPRELEIELVPVDAQQPIPGVYPLVPDRNTQKAGFNGNAVLNALLPGAKYRVTGYANMFDGSIGSGRRLLVARLDEPVSVASGETVKIELAMIGRPVSMKPSFAGMEKVIIPWELTREEEAKFRQTTITAELQRTDGKLTLTGSFNRYTGVLTFTMAEPGTYQLTLRVYLPEENELYLDVEPPSVVHVAEQPIIIPDIPGGWSVETLEIGDVVLKTRDTE